MLTPWRSEEEMCHAAPFWAMTHSKICKKKRKIGFLKLKWKYTYLKGFRYLAFQHHFK